MHSENKYLQPKTIPEAIQYSLDCKTNFRFLAGGTDILVNKFQGNDSTNFLIDITGIEELKKVECDQEFLKIGPLVTLDNLQNYSEIQKNASVLLDAAHSVGSPLIRKTATIGGNLLCENRCSFYNQSEWWREAIGNCLKCDGDICIATGGKKNCFSKFVSDTAVALIGLDAEIEIINNGERKFIALESIYTGNGISPRILTASSLITCIRIPLKEKYISVFKKLRQRESLEFSSLSTLVSIGKSGKIKIVLGGVDPKPVTVEGIENEESQLISSIIKKTRIVENDVYSRKYRKEMISVYLTRSFEELKNRLKH